jgi:hypothetical protein
MEKEHEGGGEGGSLSALRLPGSPGSPLRGEERKSPQSPAILNALGGEDMVEKVGAKSDCFGSFRGDGMRRVQGEMSAQVTCVVIGVSGGSTLRGFEGNRPSLLRFRMIWGDNDSKGG